MRRTRSLLSILTILCLGSFPVVRAAERTLVLDPAQTTIDFQLGATGHEVEGSFEMIEGSITFDTESGDVSGTVTVDATGAETDNKKRDRTMHQKVLESEKYPQFILKPERMEGVLPESGAGSVSLHGTILIHGEEHAVSLPVAVDVNGNDLGLKFVLSIPFVEWGMKDPSFLFFRVEKVVQVTVSSRGALSDSAQDVTEGDISTGTRDERLGTR